MINGKPYSPIDVGLPDLPVCYDQYPKARHDCLLAAPSEREALGDRQIILTGRTHVENLKDSVELLPPSGDLVFIVLRVEQSRSCASFPLLDDLLLDRDHSSVIGTSVSG